MTSNASGDPLTWLDGTSLRAKRVLGKGGMGVVLLAEHTTLGREVCVKLLRPEAGARPEVVDRFRLEAQALAKLGGGRHANLAEVQDFGTTPGGHWYLTMPYLAGRTLDVERKERGAMPWGEACQLVLQALAGLAVAHEAGVIHRDIKPANLFVCDAEDAGGPRVVKVLDFGILKLAEMATLAGEVQPLRVATAAGLAVGTPRYMAPEQLGAAHVDARADVYAMGLVLWSLLSGKLPYQGLDGEALIHAQLAEPLGPLDPRVPTAVVDLIARATAKRRDDRPRDARELARALQAALQAQPIKTTPLPEPAVPAQKPRGPRSTELVMEAPERFDAPAAASKPSEARPGPGEQRPTTSSPSGEAPDEGPTAQLAVRGPSAFSPAPRPPARSASPTHVASERRSWAGFVLAILIAAAAAVGVVMLLSTVIR